MSETQHSIFLGRRKTHCFGAGREHFLKVYNPGTYSDKTTNIGVQARKYSLQARNFYLDATALALKRNFPSPVNYGDPQKMDSVGNYFSSELL